MRSVAAALVLFIGGLLLASCSPDPAMLTKADERTVAAQIFATVERARSTQGEFAVPAGSSLRQGAYRGLAAELPSGKPILVGAFRFTGTTGSRTVLTYQLGGQGRYRLVSLRMRSGGADPSVDHVAIEQLPRPFSEMKGFRGSKAKGSSFALLLLPLTSIAIAVAGIARVWGRNGFGHRWLWTIGCLLSLTELRILWPSGRLFLQPLYISILPAGIRQIGPLPDSWLIVASIPVVAIFVLLRPRPTRHG